MGVRASGPPSREMRAGRAPGSHNAPLDVPAVRVPASALLRNQNHRDMPKKKNPKSSHQAELPLDPPATPPVKPATPEKPVPAAIAMPAPEVKTADVPPAPPRPRSGKVQEESAPLAKSYRNWFLEYASYVILDRAVPHLDDGLKPVQRRILHTLWEMDDGRFHKVANVVGRTMSLHPHGDASIGAALVAIGQRAFLIEPQGNYGNTLTGDDAAAPRNIEARLTNFAKEIGRASCRERVWYYV